MDNFILALIVPQTARPYLEYIPATLDSYQEQVGGNIEVVPLRFPEAIALCNDEFLFVEVPVLNRSINILRAPGVGRICGNCFIVGDMQGSEGREFRSLDILQVSMLENALNVSFAVPRMPEPV